MSEGSKVSIGSVGRDLTGNVAGNDIIQVQTTFSDLYKAAPDAAIKELVTQLQHSVLNEDEDTALDLGSTLRDVAPDLFKMAIAGLPWLAKLFGG